MRPANASRIFVLAVLLVACGRAEAQAPVPPADPAPAPDTLASLSLRDTAAPSAPTDSARTEGPATLPAFADSVEWRRLAVPPDEMRPFEFRGRLTPKTRLRALDAAETLELRDVSLTARDLIGHRAVDGHIAAAPETLAWEKVLELAIGSHGWEAGCRVGGTIGAMPGIVVLEGAGEMASSNENGAVFVAALTAILGLGLAVGGGVAGGLIGAAIGVGVTMWEPIYSQPGISYSSAAAGFGPSVIAIVEVGSHGSSGVNQRTTLAVEDALRMEGYSVVTPDTVHAIAVAVVGKKAARSPDRWRTSPEVLDRIHERTRADAMLSIGIASDDRNRPTILAFRVVSTRLAVEVYRADVVMQNARRPDLSAGQATRDALGPLRRLPRQTPR